MWLGFYFYSRAFSSLIKNIPGVIFRPSIPGSPSFASQGERRESLGSRLPFRLGNSGTLTSVVTFVAQDGAEPSANSSSVGNLIRLSGYTDQKEYVTRAEEIIKASVTLLSKLPLALPELVSNYIMYLQPKQQVKLSGVHFGYCWHSLICLYHSMGFFLSFNWPRVHHVTCK